MTTLFALLCHVCGLSHREAADWLDVRPDTVKSWSAGRRVAPDGVVEALADLAERIDEAADQVVNHLDSLDPDAEARDIEIGLAADDHEARDLGWPCVGAHRAVIGLTIARGMVAGRTFQVVPRGSTAATAAAIDIHDRARGGR